MILKHSLILYICCVQHLELGNFRRAGHYVPLDFYPHGIKQGFIFTNSLMGYMRPKIVALTGNVSSEVFGLHFERLENVFLISVTKETPKTRSVSISALLTSPRTNKKYCQQYCFKSFKMTFNWDMNKIISVKNEDWGIKNNHRRGNNFLLNQKLTQWEIYHLLRLTNNHSILFDIPIHLVKLFPFIPIHLVKLFFVLICDLHYGFQLGQK